MPCHCKDFCIQEQNFYPSQTIHVFCCPNSKFQFSHLRNTFDFKETYLEKSLRVFGRHLFKSTYFYYEVLVQYIAEKYSWERCPLQSCLICPLHAGQYQW